MLTITPAQRDTLRAIRFGSHLPPWPEVLPLLDNGLVFRTRAGRLALSAEGYTASKVMAVETPKLADFDKHADDSAAQVHVLPAKLAKVA